MAQSFCNNTNSLNTTVNITAADERSNILSWLSPLEPKQRHKDIQERRVENIGEWVLETEEFRSWYASNGGNGSDNAILFCYGDPGVGKTFISSLVMDRLGDWARGQGVTVAGFYFDYAAQKEHSPANMLGAVLRQVVGGLGVMPEAIAQAYEGQKEVIGGRAPQLADIVKMLRNTASIKRTFICIDALDECVAGYRIKILHSLDQILRSSPGTRMFVTGRPHIEAEVGKRLSGRGTAIRITPQRHDIISYLHRRLENDTTPDAMDSNLKADILKKISKDVSEMFLLVSLNVDTILQGTTIRSRRKKLDEMTDDWGLEGAYGATLDRIKGQGGEKRRLGMAALMWISHAERPLRVDELCYALGVEIGSADLDGDNVPSISTLLACCKGLVAVDKEASTVRLIHFTLQEYLQARLELLDKSHASMTETCLSYLNSHQVKALSPNSSPDYRDHQDTPFLEYSSIYWGVHAKRDLSDRAKQLALELFDDYSNHISPRILVKKERVDYFKYYSKKPLLFSGLHYASFFGIDEIVACLVEVESCDINPIDCTGSTPLAWAASNGHEGVVKMLLRRGCINPNSLDKRGQTPLHRAAVEGHEGVVKILLERDDVNPNRPDKRGRTPLCRAAVEGHSGVMKILLGREDVDPNQLFEGGQTPLSWAASEGREGAIKILFGRGDVNPDKPDKYDRTPLWCAAKNGHGKVVEMLLRRDDVNPDGPNKCGQTPLWRAALSGHGKVVEMLLRRDDVNPDGLDKYDRTPLWCAAEQGHKEVVEMLLARGDINPNTPNKHGQTPLWCAAEKGHGVLVEMLLARGDINPNTPNKHGQTPLWCAAEKGYGVVVEMLLARGDINPNTPNKHGQTPLWCAAEKGHGVLVEMLLGRGDVNPDIPNENGQTPLWRAVENWHRKVVEMLLGRADVNPDRPDIYGKTPLWRAVEKGHREVVGMLLGRADVNPDTPNKYGQTPLLCAAANGHVGIVEMLLGKDDVNPDGPDMLGETPLWWAAKNGHVGIVEMLLGKNDVNPDSPDKYGQTPLLCAAVNGRVRIVEMLLGKDDVNPDTPDRYGQTPLGCAAKNGHVGIVEMLLGKDGVNPDRPSE